MKIKGKLFDILMKILIGLVILIVIGVIAFVLMQLIGKRQLYQTVTSNPALEDIAAAYGTAEDADAMSSATWQEGDIRYNGVIYRYNSDILTFLVMGIDSKETVPAAGSEVTDYWAGGQCDAIFLVVLNPHTEEMQIIAVNRNTMTEVEMLSQTGQSLGTDIIPICVAHGYGDGREWSCENALKAVQNLFYQLPVSGYVAINMGAVADLNDAVGGVTVTSLETITAVDGTHFEKGETYTLTGDSAFWYVKCRDTSAYHSADLRLERQIQYLKAFVNQAKSATKADLSLPVSLYSALSDYMVTDITVTEVSYLAANMLDYTFDADSILSLEGETTSGQHTDGSERDEFYPDEEALYQLILQVFYEVVE